MMEETDFEKWWRQQKEWGFSPKVENYNHKPLSVTITTEAGSSESFGGYIGFCLSAHFDLDGNFINAGVWE